MFSCLQIRFKMGYCQTHFQEMLQEEDMYEQLEAHTQKKEHRRSTVKARTRKSSLGIFGKFVLLVSSEMADDANDKRVLCQTN